jgi:cob(I)alamin adenosyltransferase
MTMKIYTKTGDSGTTGLFAGPRVPKDHPRIHAYGTVDELNALLGVVLAQLPADESSSLAQTLVDIQSDLFSIGAQLATPNPEEHGMCLLDEVRIQALEHAIDAMEEELEPLSSFILPGGSPASATLHVARTVCRRAEREIVSLARAPDVTRCDQLIVYLNRLSDLLFSAARFANAKTGIADRPWKRPGD